MRILLLGGSGMIGHRLWSTLAENNEVLGTIRKNDLGLLKNFTTIKNSAHVTNLDVTDLKRVESIAREFNPDYMINCTGIVKQHKDCTDHIKLIKLNALIPHELAKIAKEVKSKLIIMSTDCVFDGAKGSYKEEDHPNAIDDYGKSKALGEIHDLDHVLTIRTSTIGHEVYPHGGLLYWFMSNRSQEVKGFDKAIYSGFPTHTFAKIINDYIFPNPNLSGVIHISSPAINKFHLLQLINDRFNLNIQIQKDSSVVVERSLDSTYFKKLTGFSPKPWEDMIVDLEKDYETYQDLKQ